MEAALYLGSIRHRRLAGRRHRIHHPLYLVAVDLDRPERAFAGSWLGSARLPAPLWLRRRDHFGDPARSWPEAVRDEAERRLGRRSRGPVLLLTHPRTWGFRMNPVSFYYLHDQAGAVDAILAEVTNTPWDERHLYVLDARRRRGRTIEARFAKQFHVSPFQPMDLEYRWRLTEPGARLAVHMESWRGESKVFDATLRLERRSLTPSNLRRAAFAHPAMTMRVFLWIYLHAMRLRLKGAPFHPHPKRIAAPSS